MSLGDVWNNIAGALSHTTPIGWAINAGQDVSQVTQGTVHTVQKVQKTASNLSNITAPNKGSGKTPAGFAPWLAAMIALAAVVLLMSDSEKWEPVGGALVAVIAFTVAVRWGKPALYGVDEAFGTAFISKPA